MKRVGGMREAWGTTLGFPFVGLRIQPPVNQVCQSPTAQVLAGSEATQDGNPLSCIGIDRDVQGTHTAGMLTGCHGYPDPG